jgi:hypothetical protein
MGHDDGNGRHGDAARQRRQAARRWRRAA